MPNWCENKMTLRHTDPAMLKRARDAWMSGNFLNEFIPIPEDLKIVAGRVGGDTDPEQVLLVSQQATNKAKHGYQDWYSFCVNEWGTKWDIGCRDGNEPYDETDISFTVNYESAWSPPEAACFKLVKMGFEVTNYYYEPGMGFCGVFEDGDDACYNINEAPPDLKEMFGIDILEINLDKNELIEAIVDYDIKEAKDTGLDFEDLLRTCYKDGNTGYIQMSHDELKQEYIDRELHINAEKSE